MSCVLIGCGPLFLNKSASINSFIHVTFLTCYSKNCFFSIGRSNFNDCPGHKSNFGTKKTELYCGITGCTICVLYSTSLLDRTENREKAPKAFVSRLGTKPSTEGWHIRKAFWMLSSNVWPTAVTCEEKRQEFEDRKCVCNKNNTNMKTLAIMNQNYYLIQD